MSKRFPLPQLICIPAHANRMTDLVGAIRKCKQCGMPVSLEALNAAKIDSGFNLEIVCMYCVYEAAQAGERFNDSAPMEGGKPLNIIIPEKAAIAILKELCDQYPRSEAPTA